MFARAFSNSNQAAKRLAIAIVASPALLIALLFVVRPEALGTPATKLLVMTVAACLLMSLGELSGALAKWMQPHLEARTSRPPAAAPETTVLDVLVESRRFG
jgi:hypothetical protein